MLKKFLLSAPVTKETKTTASELAVLQLLTHETFHFTERLVNACIWKSDFDSGPSIL